MNKLFSLTAAVALLTGVSVAQVKPQVKQTVATTVAAAKPATVAGSDLIAQLPASDFAATMNFKRLVSEVLPQMLASKPAELNKLNAGIDEIKAKTGIDLREFESAAMSVNYKQSSANGFDLEPLLLLRGSFKPAALLNAAKGATNGKFRQETIAGKTAAIFTIPAQKTPAGGANQNSNQIERMIDRLMTGEVAVVALDNNTLAVAKPAQLRATLGATVKTRVAADFTDFFARKPTAVLNFAGSIPTGLANSVGAGNDQFGAILSSLKQVYGTVDTNGSDAAVSLAAQTGTDTQAQELEELLNLAQTFGKGMLGGKQDAKNQALARVVETLTVSRAANRVQIEAIVPPDALNAIIK